MARQRRQRGKMLVLVALVTVMISFVFVVGLVLMTLFSQHNRAQYNVDALVLSMARILNSDDRVGQVNQALARNRELVYTTRQDYIGCEEQGLGHLSPLFEQLMDEAYAGHELIETERRNEIELVSSELLKATRDYNEHRNGGNISIFPWLKTFEPEVTRVDVGCIKNVQSNVQESTAVEDLADYDREQNFVQPQSNLLRANLNLKLPVPDESLEYKLSALPALVKNSCAPPRVAGLTAFEQYPIVIRDPQNARRPNDRMPHAVKIYTSMDVALDGDKLDPHQITINSVGVAGGAVSNY